VLSKKKEKKWKKEKKGRGEVVCTERGGGKKEFLRTQESNVKAWRTKGQSFRHESTKKKTGFLRTAYTSDVNKGREKEKNTSKNCITKWSS